MYSTVMGYIDMASSDKQVVMKQASYEEIIVRQGTSVPVQGSALPA